MTVLSLPEHYYSSVICLHSLHLLQSLFLNFLSQIHSLHTQILDCESPWSGHLIKHPTCGPHLYFTLDFTHAPKIGVCVDINIGIFQVLHGNIPFSSPLHQPNHGRNV
jgi:hypothetical protein